VTVIVALFGENNFAWPQCQGLNLIVTMMDEVLYQFWRSGDRQGFIAAAENGVLTARGNRPTTATASRWFNLGDRVAQTSGDLWLHRDGDKLWWTRSKPDPFWTTAEAAEPPHRIRPYIMIRKSCEPWSDKDATGRPLRFGVIHPKAEAFLTTQSTQITPRADGGDYAEALIAGESLDRWHNLPAWRARLAQSGAGLATFYTAIEKAIWRMADGAFNTARYADGRIVETTSKIKNVVDMTQESLREHIRDLLKEQGNLCALTELRLQFDSEQDDQEMLPSLDRIDSSGHYEKGNLQIVCRFANRWKGASENSSFMRLIGLLKN
jgi:hypothetical protein